MSERLPTRRLLVGLTVVVLLAGCGASASPIPTPVTPAPASVPSVTVATLAPTVTAAAPAAPTPTPSPSPTPAPTPTMSPFEKTLRTHIEDAARRVDGLTARIAATVPDVRSVTHIGPKLDTLHPFWDLVGESSSWGGPEPALCYPLNELWSGILDDSPDYKVPAPYRSYGYWLGQAHDAYDTLDQAKLNAALRGIRRLNVLVKDLAGQVAKAASPCLVTLPSLE